MTDCVLPATGSDPLLVVLLAFLVLGTGVALVLGVRRRGVSGAATVVVALALGAATLVVSDAVEGWRGGVPAGDDCRADCSSDDHRGDNDGRGGDDHHGGHDDHRGVDDHRCDRRCGADHADDGGDHDDCGDHHDCVGRSPGPDAVGRRPVLDAGGKSTGLHPHDHERWDRPDQRSN